jgi:hypothetical protein
MDDPNLMSLIAMTGRERFIATSFEKRCQRCPDLSTNARHNQPFAQ